MKSDKRIQLSAAWHAIHGTDIPRHMEMLPDEEIERALQHARRRLEPVCETGGSDDAMMDHDGWKP